jgi:hypothetical protein
MGRLLSILICLLTIASQGQNYVDLFKIEYDQAIPQSFEDTAVNGQFRELSVDLLAPLIFPGLNNKSPLLTGFLFEQTKVSIGPSDERVFYGAMLKLGINIKHTKKWSGTYLLLPKLSSDLRRIRKSDFQLGGLALIKYSPTPNFNYRFGFYANSDLYAPMLVPIFGIYLLKNKWEITSALPINCQVGYQVHPKLQLALRFDGINKSYLINDDSNTYMEKVNNEVGALVRYAIGKIQIQLFGGYGIGRSFRTYMVGDRFDFALSAIKINNNRTILNEDFRDGPVFRTSLTFRFPTN